MLILFQISRELYETVAVVDVTGFLAGFTTERSPAQTAKLIAAH
jgi:hypothetical protein